MGLDFDGWIAKVRAGEHLDEWDLKQLCDYVKELLIEESNVQVCQAPKTKRREFSSLILLRLHRAVLLGQRFEEQCKLKCAIPSFSDSESNAPFLNCILSTFPAFFSAFKLVMNLTECLQTAYKQPMYSQWRYSWSIS